MAEQDEATAPEQGMIDTSGVVEEPVVLAPAPEDTAPVEEAPAPAPEVVEEPVPVEETPAPEPVTYGPLAAPAAADGRVYLALLDGTGRLTGYDYVDAWQEGDTGLPVPDGCDLRPLHYRYDVSNRRFDPINPLADESKIAAAPDTLFSIAAGLKAVRDSGKIALPQVTLDWLEWYKTTIDGAKL